MIISWNSTNQCNMFCDHCYRDSGIKSSQELNTKEAKALLDEIKKAGFKIMIFSGGEPLMRNDLVELVAYAKAIGLRPVLGSNGTLLTPELAADLKNAGAMGIGISLDSMSAEKHDKLRQYKGAWKEAVRGMNICKKAGLPFQIHTTVMDWNTPELEALTDFAVDEGAVAHHFFFLVPTGRGASIEDTSLRAAEYESVITRIMQKQKEVAIELKPTCAPQFMRIAKELHIETRFGRGCLAGTAYCIISPTGKVQPCAYMDMEIGDVRQTPFSEIWANSTVFKTLRSFDYSGYCGHCRYKKSCGGCRARAAYYHNGDYMAEEPWCLYQGGKKEVT
ncbi:MAG: putative heme d1 biosynthesis radical SAM protein NirJ2 [Tindallia sp. MSAO_Bac2]|nr:MAG: putative heme d1 biosynthesis radical SAM protein NirJ2 [Tindallia sp. MSAO_Bac2]